MLAGRYRISGPLGRGAIAEVVRARDEATGEEVALKILYPHLEENAAVVARFRHEVDIVRRVAHPHVLAIRSIEQADGALFLVMDFHPGGDLADRLARGGRLASPDVRTLAAQLAGALAEAHRAGVVHRDVKPSNVLCGAGPALDVRLCDFGLARTADFSGLTTANAVLGTPEYMAPEVVTDGHADPRSDIYSLGVVLFEAATGRLPFYGDSPYQLMRQHVDAEAPRARGLVPELPVAIDDAIARALAKDPLDRFATADDLARALVEGGDGTKSATATTALATRPARSTSTSPTPERRTCRRCAGWVVEAAAVCVDCGTRTLRLERERPGVSVLVTGPGKPGEKLDAWKHVMLYRLLDELPAGWTPTERKRRRAPRVPFFVARGITLASAKLLVERLRDINLDARVDDGTPDARKMIRRKVWRLTRAYLAGFGVTFNPATWNLLPRPWGGLFGFFFLPVGIGAAYLGLFAGMLVRGYRPLIAAATGSGALPLARLAAVLPRLSGRQDRRLLGHIIERLRQLGAPEHGELTDLVASRVAGVGEALVALEVRRGHGASVSVDAGEALGELRAEERARVVLRADLLRAASRLDDLGLALARAGAAGSSDEVAALKNELAELELVVQADEDVRALLRGA